MDIPDPTKDPEFMKTYRDYKQKQHEGRQAKFTKPYVTAGAGCGLFVAGVISLASHIWCHGFIFWDSDEIWDVVFVVLGLILIFWGNKGRVQNEKR